MTNLSTHACSSGSCGSNSVTSHANVKVAEHILEILLQAVARGQARSAEPQCFK